MHTVLCGRSVIISSDDVLLGNAEEIKTTMGGMTLFLGSIVLAQGHSAIGSILASITFTLPSSPITATGTC